MYPRDLGVSLQKWAHTQVAVGARMACYHDEIKVCLPAILTPQQHLLFTFFHVDLQTKLEAPKPVSPCSYTAELLYCVVALVLSNICVFFTAIDLTQTGLVPTIVQVIIGYAALPLSTHVQYVFFP